MDFDPRFVHFVVLFNKDEDYFECHEVMEELWLEEGRNLLYQGLLQAAVGLHHWQNDNYTGAVKLFAAGLDKLSGYRDEEMGLDLRQLRLDMANAHAPLQAWVERQRPDSIVQESQPPPKFTPFRLVMVHPVLAKLVWDMAQIPLEQRIHGEEENPR
jgi:hypothetical protein